MISPILSVYIKNALTQGKTRQQISVELISQGGWSQSDIDQAFAAIQGVNPVPVNGSPVLDNIATSTPNHWLIGLVTFLVTIIGTYFYWQIAVPVQVVDTAFTVWVSLTLIINLLCVWAFAALFRVSGQFSKALLYVGLGGIAFLALEFSNLLHQPMLIYLLSLLEVVVLCIIFYKVYSTSIAKTIGVFIVSGFVTAIFSVILLFLPIFAGLISFANIFNSSPIITQNNSSGLSTTTINKVANSQTYNNSQYGFSFQYPDSLAIEPISNNLTGPFKTPSIAYVPMRNDAVQTEGYLTVNVSSDSANVARCIKPGAVNSEDLYLGTNSKQSLTGNSTVVINSIPFVQSDSITSTNIGIERNYTAVQNGICYDIEIVSYPSACINSGCEDRQWSQQTKTDLLNRLDKVAQSFSITSSQTSNTLPTLSFLSPLGKEIWAQGSTHNLKWTSTNINQIGLILLVDSNGGTEVIASNIPDSAKSFTWRINSPTDKVTCTNCGMSSPLGSNYHIRFETWPDKIDFDSKPFSIVANSNTSVLSTPTQPISISSVNGPISLTVGQVGKWAIQSIDSIGYAVIWADGTPIAVSGESGIPNNFVSSNTFTHSFAKAGSYYVQFFAKVSNGDVVSKNLTIKVTGSNSTNTNTGSTVSSSVHITSLTSSSGVIGSMLSINGTGFTSNENNIYFSGATSGYLQNTYSPSGTTITFPVPSELYGCTNVSGGIINCTSTQDTQLGKYTISVLNNNGMSNTIPFEILSSGSNQSAASIPVVTSVLSNVLKPGGNNVAYGTNLSHITSMYLVPVGGTQKNYLGWSNGLGTSVFVTLPSIPSSPSVISSGQYNLFVVNSAGTSQSFEVSVSSN